MTASIRGGIFTMAMLLKGAEVAKALTEGLHAKTEELKKNGVEPCLAILRVGAREDDLAYERGALKRCEKVGVAVRQVVLPEDVTQKVLMENIHALNADEKVHGVLMFRPLPGHLDDEAARAALDPKKDMDGITDGSMTAVYAGTKGGYPPCTAAACVALLKHYNIPIKGKRVVVIGRSLVIGKPVSLLLLAEHATVTICHSRSENLPEICREADILVVAAGKAGMVGAESVRAGQVVLDVGIHVGADGNLCGDTRFAEVEPVVEAITPVPGGVGTVTSTILASHVVEAAERARKETSGQENRRKLMGLYDSVDRGKPKPKRLTGPIALCCALFLLFGGLTYWACHHQFRFHAFISDLTDSTRDARSTETFRVTVNGSEADVSIDDLSDLLYLIDKAGAGRTAAAPEEMPYAVIDYGDGSTLEIWKVELVNPSNDWTEGPFFRYTDAKGKSYGYDTDQLRWESVVRLLGE